MKATTRAWLHKNRSNIEFVAGMGLNMLGMGLLVKATKKNAPVIEAHKADMYDAKQDNDEKAKSEICKRTVKETAKNYSLAGATLIASYALLGDAKKTDNKELGVVNAALATTTVAYEALKEKIIAKHGEEEWLDLNGVKELEVVDTTTGEVSREVSIEGLPFATFSVLFDEANPCFSSRPGDNRRFLSLKLAQATQDLAEHKIVMLLDILCDPKYGMGYSRVPGEYFSEEQLKAMTNAGWYYGGEGSPTGVISFGLELRNERTEAFMLDRENAIWLEFNCVPDVYAEIARQKRLTKA